MLKIFVYKRPTLQSFAGWRGHWPTWRRKICVYNWETIAKRFFAERKARRFDENSRVFTLQWVAELGNRRSSATSPRWCEFHFHFGDRFVKAFLKTKISVKGFLKDFCKHTFSRRRWAIVASIGDCIVNYA